MYNVYISFRHWSWNFWLCHMIFCWSRSIRGHVMFGESIRQRVTGCLHSCPCCVGLTCLLIFTSLRESWQGTSPSSPAGSGGQTVSARCCYCWWFVFGDTHWTDCWYPDTTELDCLFPDSRDWNLPKELLHPHLVLFTIFLPLCLDSGLESGVKVFIKVGFLKKSKLIWHIWTKCVFMLLWMWHF